MKTTLVFLSLLFFAGFSYAEEKRIASPFVRYSVEENQPNLKKGEALFVFEFKELEEGDKDATITLSKDGKENEEIQLKEGVFEYKVKPGTHQFTIYINDNYFELYSFGLIIGSREKHVYHVTPFKTNGMMIEVDKPVIYLYPEKSSEFEVTVDPVGEMAFTYPKYEESWKGVMHPDGRIEVAEETFRYLFWESKQAFSALNPQTTDGFVVAQKDVVSFLEEQLNAVGFTAMERADFITFWEPQMQKHPNVFVTFHQNKACNNFAELNITPTPDNILRFYMSWGAYEGDFTPTPQTLTPFNRTGFTVVEWGGQEIPTINNTLTL